MIPTPHDALVKVVFGKPEHAQGRLRAVVPAAVAETLDWSTLTLRPGSFVDLALKEQHTDLLYSATWRDGGEGSSTSSSSTIARADARNSMVLKCQFGTW
jgi:hypothetical protein